MPSSDTRAYSKARKRLPLAVVQQLLTRTAQALQAQVSLEKRSLWPKSQSVCGGTGRDDERYGC